ncbi:flagellar basal-body rod protein FlgF [Bacillus halotolerans]|uniref:Flagellar basal body rod protein FlgG n=1 Tax=Bacillus halotolerans TaxID=260554 RepID=A0A9Q6F0C4_9BACI|nr:MULTISPECIES: flagellar basal body rod protein FlgG [Bacillus]MBV7320644.1 flagellar basal body rod protein FlgG [Halalkalibacterium halodurans]QQF61224.1 flagellar basal body rod protein FlgG [Bacillus mojavensis]AZV47750.1 flagellar basal body rod protein FlgG [Bacillus halotolerans]KUP32989.1 flagellar basal-body rod protein FlgG [Bacillus halotolerans]KUP33427.1 flagellar basal-body rod protein FlgG [Bacillus halotolerans]
MLRSLYSGISGMKNFQTKLDVIGNNIANVNTVGFKKSRVTFKDMVSQTIAGGSAAGATIGGTNSKQIGLGSSSGTIDTIHSTSATQSTGRTLDLAIDGDGYFQIDTGDGTAYTRAGNFYLDNTGTLVTGDGYHVLNMTGGTIKIPLDAQSFSIGSDGKVSIVDAGGKPQDGGQIGIVTFANSDGLDKIGSNLYRESLNSGTASAANQPGDGGTGALKSGFIEMSNVDLTDEFTEMIVAQRGFQSNSKIITTSDEILQELVNLKR